MSKHHDVAKLSISCIEDAYYAAVAQLFVALQDPNDDEKNVAFEILQTLGRNSPTARASMNLTALHAFRTLQERKAADAEGRPFNPDNAHVSIDDVDTQIFTGSMRPILAAIKSVPDADELPPVDPSNPPRF